MRWLITGSLFVLAACGSSGPGGSSKIGSAGGKVATADGTVDVPAGAVSADTTFTITATPDAPVPSKATVVGTALTLGPEGTTFSKPVAVTLAVDPAKLPMGKVIGDVVVYTAPKGSTQYTRLFTRVVDATHVEALTTHFSVFVATVPGACAVRCSPGSATTGGGSGGTGGSGGSSDAGSTAPTCGCSSTCLPDGTTPPPCSGGTSGGGSGGTGGSADAGSCQSAGMVFTLSCSGSTCTCTGGGSANLTCSATTTPEQAFAAYQACGGPGELVPPAPSGGGTNSTDAGTTTGGGGSGSGPNGCMVGAIGDCAGCSVTCQTGQATCTPPMTPPGGSCMPATCTCR
ncbi:MAG: hypothetical protein K1X89_01500 [Myxococcaceae bacterium]|nr:hypothetical protein [Myxococcaceae bacterium]